jgi:phosphoglycolate phosphatase
MPIGDIRHVIWDFNGTLLDDVDCCVGTLNTLLGERGLPAISRLQYLARFGFPVRDFYLELGFDLAAEDFDRIATTYISRYAERLDDAVVHDRAHEALAELRRRNIGQSVVSAMELSLLQRLLERFGLLHYMTEVRGLEHNAATSKIELGLALQHDLDLLARQTLLIGDTLHDLEVARAIGCECLLYARGHQARERLQRSGAPLIESLAGVIEFLDGAGCGP